MVLLMMASENSWMEVEFSVRLVRVGKKGEKTRVRLKLYHNTPIPQYLQYQIPNTKPWYEIPSPIVNISLVRKGRRYMTQYYELSQWQEQILIPNTVHKYWPQIQHISSKYHSYQNLSCKKEEKKFFHIDHITIVTELCTWRPILLLFAMSMAYS